MFRPQYWNLGETLICLCRVTINQNMHPFIASSDQIIVDGTEEPSIQEDAASPSNTLTSSLALVSHYMRALSASGHIEPVQVALAEQSEVSVNQPSIAPPDSHDDHDSAANSDILEADGMPVSWADLRQMPIASASTRNCGCTRRNFLSQRLGSDCLNPFCAPPSENLRTYAFVADQLLNGPTVAPNLHSARVHGLLIVQRILEVDESFVGGSAVDVEVVQDGMEDAESD